jgi:hypothetical protein
MAPVRAAKLSRRGDQPPASQDEARKAIYGKLNLDLVVQILDIQPDFYETRLAGFLRRLMRDKHNERWNGKNDLYE